MSSDMAAITTIGLIGAGNLAWNLSANLDKTGFSVEQVISRSTESAKELAKKFNIPMHDGRLEALHPDLDLVFLCVPDDKLAGLAKDLISIAGDHTVFAHCSGTSPLTVLSPLGERGGVMWPIQTLTKTHIADFADVPLMIEGRGRAIELIRHTARSLSQKVVYADSAQRLRLHLGAVFVSNFPNLLFQIATELTKGMDGINLGVYGPLIREAVNNALIHGPENVQTGPAKRGDQITLSNHLQLLENEDQDLARLYQLISDMIVKRSKRG